MNNISNDDLKAILQKRRIQLSEEQHKMLASPNKREQELLTSLSKLKSPLTAFQEEWFRQTFFDVNNPFMQAALNRAKGTFGIGEPDTELDKFQIATIRLIDTIHGYFAGNHPVTLIDSARATCEVISGLMKDFQQSGLLPHDMQLIYKLPREVTEDSDEYTQISSTMHKVSRAHSNASKHSDKDARKVRSYSDISNLQHLMYSMLSDYEELHCGLLEAGLLSTDLEKLYPVERSLLVKQSYHYKKIYDPDHIEMADSHDEGISSMTSIFADVMDQFDTREVQVPAAALACLLFSKEGLYARHSADTRASVLKTMEDLRIWPVSASTNARIVRDPSILELHDTPQP